MTEKLKTYRTITEFQYQDGWYMRIGQVYSSPYESYHAKIVGIYCEEKDYGKPGNYIVDYVHLNPFNYNEQDDDFIDHAYAWWFNEGVWDLEKEPDDVRFADDIHSKGDDQ